MKYANTIQTPAQITSTQDIETHEIRKLSRGRYYNIAKPVEVIKQTIGIEKKLKH